MFSNTEIGSRITAARSMKGLTLDDVASKVGVAKSTIMRYEKGTISKIKLPIIESIAHALSVNPNWLIGNSNDPYISTRSSFELTPDEEQLVTDYRDASEEIREEASGMLHRSAERNRKEGASEISSAG